MDYNQFSNFTQFDIKKFKTYFRIIQSYQTVKLVKTIEKNFNQFYKNKI